jgi:hypothetical protein
VRAKGEEGVRMNQQDSHDAPDHLADSIEFTLCGLDFDVNAEERYYAAMRREERREQAIAWLREQRAIYLDKRRLPNLIKGFSTYKRTRARRRIR